MSSVNETDRTQTTAEELLAEAKEFVDAVAGTEKSDENFVSTGIAMTRAMQLRHKADALDYADARIARARALQIKIRKYDNG